MYSDFPLISYHSEKKLAQNIIENFENSSMMLSTSFFVLFCLIYGGKRVLKPKI